MLKLTGLFLLRAGYSSLTALCCKHLSTVTINSQYLVIFPVFRLINFGVMIMQNSITNEKVSVSNEQCSRNSTDQKIANLKYSESIGGKNVQNCYN